MPAAILLKSSTTKCSRQRWTSVQANPQKQPNRFEIDTVFKNNRCEKGFILFHFCAHHHPAVLGDALAARPELFRLSKS
jgi:hypothetical protein